jgi:monoamine oxidase
MPAVEKDPDVLDVAIVGGGVSGIYSGWRLLSSQPSGGPSPPKVALFEGSGRLGGRLLSVVPPDIPDARVELGGMRYTSGHKRVQSLIDHLGLAVDRFPVSEPQNIAYVRGKMLRDQDLGAVDKIPYNLAPDERDPAILQAGFTAVAAVRALNAMGRNVSLADLKNVDWIEVANNCRYLGHRLSELPMQFVIQRGISQEAFHFAQDTCGYDSILHTGTRPMVFHGTSPTSARA